MAVKVYYLDDEEYLCEVFKQYLDSDEIQVTIFSEAQDAIECCRRLPPDVIFIDYRLSDTTGDKVAEQLDSRIPKILVTGELTPFRGGDMLQRISKPYLLAEIKALIEQQYAS